MLRPAVLLAALAVAGCGGDKQRVTATTTATSRTTATPATPTPPASADRAVVREALLRLEDLPSGWTEDEPTPSSSPRCDAVKQARASASGRATSAPFSHSADHARHTVYVYTQEQQARAAFEALSSPAARECLGDDLAKRLQEGLDEQGDQSIVGNVSVSRLGVDPLGADSSAFRAAMPVLDESGVDVDAYIDVLLNRVDRGVSMLILASTFSPVDDDLRGATTKAAVRRLDDALEG